MAILTKERWQEGDALLRKAFLLDIWSISSILSPDGFPNEFVAVLFAEGSGEEGIFWKIFSKPASNKHEEKTRALAFRVCCNSLIDALALSRVLSCEDGHLTEQFLALTAKAESLSRFLLSLRLSRDIEVPAVFSPRYEEFFWQATKEEKTNASS